MIAREDIQLFNEEEEILEENQEQSDPNLLSLLTELLCLLKRDPIAFPSNNKISLEELSILYEKRDFEKFNGPLEKPKTANKAFGSISDFLLFFENRNPEIKEFAILFQEMEKTNSIFPGWSIRILNQKITPALCKSFKKMQAEFKNYESSFKVPLQGLTKNQENALKKLFQKKKNQKDPKNEYAQLFEKEFQNLEEFYKQILHAYTIPGFLYLRMNEYLRTENWMKLDELLIYTYCLFKAYLWGPTGLTNADSFEYLKSKTENGKLTLYRRADFDQASLDFYHLDRIREFSWSGVTSTSLTESATHKFTGKQPDKKPVLIVIEVDFQDLQPKNFNALYLAALSKCPAEEEVALAPGSIFELVERKTESYETKIKLKLITNAETLAQQGRILHGMLQSMMRNEKELKIFCLNGKDLSRAIKHCQGNLILQDLEFSLCDFNQKASGILTEVLPTIKNLAAFRLNGFTIEADCSFKKIFECLDQLKIKEFEISLNEESHVKGLIESMHHLSSLRKIKLIIGQAPTIDRKLIRESCYSSFKHLHPECLFELEIQDEFHIFIKQGHKNYFLPLLEKVLNSSHSIDKGDSNESSLVPLSPKNQCLMKKEGQGLRKSSPEQIENSSKGFGNSLILPSFKLTRSYSESLITLFLDLRCCLTNNNFNFENVWNQGKTNLNLLTSLSFDFHSCGNMIEKSLMFLKGLQYLKVLKKLYLHFEKCHQITDETLKNLQNQGIYDLRSLHTLHLNFEACSQISDQGLKFFEDLKNLNSLTTLHLNFSECSRITNDSLKNLCEGVCHLKLLNTLHLNFEACSQITDEGFAGFSRKGICRLKLLAMISLNFSRCGKITQKEVDNLKKDVTSHLEFFVHLHLRFDCSPMFGFQNQNVLPVDIYGFDDLLNLKGLRTLQMRFCDMRMTGSSFKELVTQFVNHLKILTDLHLDFRKDVTFTDINFSTLFEGIQNVQYLTDLHLNFDGCSQITDKGLEYLACHGVLHFKLLKSLYLSFDKCGNITFYGFTTLFRILQSQPLTHFFLNVPMIIIPYWPESPISKFDFSANCLIIAKNKIQKRSIERLNLIRSKANLKNEPKNIEDSWRISDEQPAANLICSTKKTFSLQSKIDFLDETSLKVLTEGEIESFRDDLLTFERCQDILSILLDKIFWKKMDFSQSLLKLNLSFDRCLDFQDVDLQILANRAIRNFKSLKTLQLKFKRCDSVTDKGLQGLCCEGIWHLNSLDTLELVFDECKRITDEGLKNIFNKRIQNFKQLTALNLSFHQCTNITNEGIKSLCVGGIQHLKSLEILDLTFNWNKKITDKGLEVLCYEGIRHLKTLKRLSLSFDGDHNITNAGLGVLSSHGIRKLQSLTTLNLSFLGCSKISIKGLETLNCKGIWFLKSLMTLSLNFDWCPEIRISEFEFFSSQVILQIDNWRTYEISSRRMHLSRLDATPSIDPLMSSSDICVVFVDRPSFYLSENPLEVQSDLVDLFKRDSWFRNVLSQNLNEDNSSVIKEHKLRDYITVKFKDPERVFDCDLFDLNFEDEILFSQLEICHYIFDGCTNLTGKGNGFVNFCRQGIRNFKSLTALNLSFNGCLEITDEGIQTLCYEGIQHLKSLAKLVISFKECPRITDEGVKILCREGLGNFKFLEMLSLNFSGSYQITDDGFEYLCREGFSHLKSLKSLHLNFDRRNRISDRGFQYLCRESIPHLQSLKSLSLNFELYDGLSDLGLRGLCYETIKQLNSLTSLQFVLTNGGQITEKGLKTLISEGLPMLLQLKDPQISFLRNLNVSPNIYQAFLRIMLYFGFEVKGW